MNNKNQKVAEELNKLLADYQIFYQNLRGLHWNVTGNAFFMLHEKYEELYNEAAEVIDEIAERILMIGGQPLHTFGDYIALAKMDEIKNVSNGKQGVKLVLANSGYLLNSFKQILALAGEAGDEGTVAMIGEWIAKTEKRIWMLEAFLSE